MARNVVYLRPNIKVEPLIDQWYAWPHLIPPVTAARNLMNRHFPIMDSYVSAPEVHAEAVKNPKLLGGPFIDYDGGRVDEISELRARTAEKRNELIELSRAIDELDKMLKESARGFSLQPLYDRVPSPLRGLVELVYDLNDNASFRLFEGLIYKSKYYNRSAQTLALSSIAGDARPFVLSTPRLSAEDVLELGIGFGDKRVDWLFRLKQEPVELDEVFDRLGIPASKQSLASMFFGEMAGEKYEAYDGDGIRWRYFGHACILVEAHGVSILFDPVLSYTYENDISRYTYEDLPDVIDYVVITHNHQDHILLETILQIRHKVSNFIVPRSGGGALQDPSVKLILENVGCKNVIELSDMEELPFPGGSITGIPFLGEHADLDIRAKLGYLVRIHGRALLFLADSCNIEPLLYEHVRREIGYVDAVFIGMECDGAPLTWLYGPLTSRKVDRAMDSSRRLAGSNFGQAIDIVKRFDSRHAYVYAMGQEPWLNYVMSIKYTDVSKPIIESNRFLEECKRRGVVAERLFGEREILIS